jgi:hypothetical protein
MISRLRFGPWRRFYAWAKGVIDARRGQPMADRPALCDTEQQLIHIANGCIERTCEQGETRYNRLVAKCRSLAQRVVEREGHLRDAEKEYVNTKKLLDAYMESGNPTHGAVIPRAQLSWRTYILLMSAIGIGEGAFNFVVFEVFQEILPLTFAMSLAVMVGLPALGHFAGMSTRHKKYTVGWILIAVGLAALASITYLRLYFLQSEAANSDASAVPTAPAMSHVMGLAYFFISVMIFVVAIAIAYFYHEPDEQLDGLKKDKQRAERRWRKEEGQYGSDRRCLLAMSGALEGTRAYVSRTIKGLTDAGTELLTIFRRANRNWRRRSDPPPSYFLSYDNVNVKFTKVPQWADQNGSDPISEILRAERESSNLVRIPPPQTP